ncbi:MAG: hypothetical protein ACLTDR_07720 [Adlercreutzia equolifaciens]
MQTVSVCAYAEPLTAVVLGALVLGEVMAPVQLAGARCIIGGALLGEARVKLPAAQRRRMRRAYVRLVHAQRRVLHHAALDLTRHRPAPRNTPRHESGVAASRQAATPCDTDGKSAATCQKSTFSKIGLSLAHRTSKWVPRNTRSETFAFATFSNLDLPIWNM